MSTRGEVIGKMGEVESEIQASSNRMNKSWKYKRHSIDNRASDIVTAYGDR